MRKVLIMLLSFVLIGCESYKKEEVKGIWYAYSNDDDYMELWISDSTSLSYLAAVEEFETFEFGIKSNIATFKLVDSFFEHEREFSFEILELVEGEYMLVEEQIPAKSRLKYHFVSSEIPQFSMEVSGNDDLLQDIHDRMIRVGVK